MRNWGWESWVKLAGGCRPSNWQNRDWFPQMTVYQKTELFPFLVAMLWGSNEAITEMYAANGDITPLWGFRITHSSYALTPNRAEMITVKLCGKNKQETSNILLQFFQVSQIFCCREILISEILLEINGPLAWAWKFWDGKVICYLVSTDKNSKFNFLFLEKWYLYKIVPQMYICLPLDLFHFHKNILGRGILCSF